MLVLLLALILLSNSAESAEKSRMKTRIYGGTKTTILKYQYLAQLHYIEHEEMVKCGSSIISKRHILTAAHCTFGLEAKDLSVRVNSTFAGRGGKVYTCSTIHQHPHYDNNTLINDISVITLSTPLVIGVGVQPITIARSWDTLAPNTKMEIAGWGLTELSTQFPDNLYRADVGILESVVCQWAYGGNRYEFLPDKNICAGYLSGGIDTCIGDSGGPLSANGVLYGVVSWGPSPCAEIFKPGVYVQVNQHWDFIGSAIIEELQR